MTKVHKIEKKDSWKTACGKRTTEYTGEREGIKTTQHLWQVTCLKCLGVMRTKCETDINVSANELIDVSRQIGKVTA